VSNIPHDPQYRPLRQPSAILSRSRRRAR